MAEPCPGCGARFPDDPEGPHHRYVVSSSGCWAAFSEVLAREFGHPDWFALHRLTVDTYMAQHPSGDDRRQRQSPVLHLVAIRHALDGVDPRVLNAATARLAAQHRDWPVLAAPSTYPMTVADLLEVTTADEHLERVRAWAAATWDAWRAHQVQIAAWAAEALADGRDA